LKFSIANQPVWAKFDTASGALTGAPAAGDVGSYANIIISVSDGKTSASLSPFTVTVTQISNAVAELQWIPPTDNTDGSVLTDLAGYKIYYGTSAIALTQTVTITNPGLTVYTVGNLSPGTWYFVMTSHSTAGVESVLSGVLSATL
jgi:Fibronectin type III domain